MPEMKPILFNTQMVRANMAGLKTNTRRVMKPQPVFRDGYWELGGAAWSKGIKRVIPMPNHSLYERMPYKEGDVIYVRENWAITSELPGVAESGAVYMADYPDRELAELRRKHFKWRPSIHMPKELARLFLRVTDVHAEQLQEIDAAGIRAEGLLSMGAYVGDPIAREEFKILWDSTMKPAERELYGWKANPWVWVIQYERCEKPGRE